MQPIQSKAALPSSIRDFPVQQCHQCFRNTEIIHDQSLLHTTKLFLQEKTEIISSPRITQQFAKAESPALHRHFCGILNTLRHTITTSVKFFSQQLKTKRAATKILKHKILPVTETHFCMLNCQYVTSSVNQGLLGRHG